MSDRKPVGGLRKVTLYDAEAVVAVSREGSVSRLTLRAGAEGLEPRLVEGRSSLKEQLHCVAQAPLVEQRLELVLRRADGMELFTPRLLRRAAYGRWVALVEYIDGSRTLYGWSEELQGEAALRTERVEFLSGATRSELPTCHWLLTGFDVTAATPYSETEISYDTI